MADPEYFTVAELRALPDVSNTTKYPEALVLAAAAYITQIIEREVGTSFIERTITDEAHDGGCKSVILAAPFVRSIDAVTEDDIDIADKVSLRSGGVLYRTDGVSSYQKFAAGFGNVVVSYTAGYSATVPKDIKGAALQATRSRLLDTSTTGIYNDRTTSMNTDMGNIQYVIAGSDHPTGYPAVDAVIVGWREQLSPLGIG